MHVFMHELHKRVQIFDWIDFVLEISQNAFDVHVSRVIALRVHKFFERHESGFLDFRLIYFDIFMFCESQTTKKNVIQIVCEWKPFSKQKQAQEF